MRGSLSRFFGVAAQARTWLNLVYLWLALPLGVFYFVFLTVGLSVGLGLVVIWLGIPILLLVVGAWWLFGAFERAQVHYLLGMPVAPSPRAWETVEGVWGKLKSHFGHPATWKDLAFLFVKLPLGIVSFTLATTAVAVTFALLSAPIFWYFEVPMVDGSWVPPLWAALLAVPAGVLSFFVWLHALNAWAWVCGRWAQVMFGTPTHHPLPPAAATGTAKPMDEVRTS